MAITSALVLLVIIWFIALFVVLPIGLRTQSDEGSITRGTPGSAPAGPVMRRKFLWASLIALLIWAVICAIILSGVITLDDIDLYRRVRG